MISCTKKKSIILIYIIVSIIIRFRLERWTTTTLFYEYLELSELRENNWIFN